MEDFFTDSDNTPAVPVENSYPPQEPEFEFGQPSEPTQDNTCIHQV